MPVPEAPAPREVVGDAAPAAHTILYIEDNLANLKIVEHILARRPGCTLIPALQGRIGIDLARQHHPDLILLDLNLPDISGDEVLRRLRADSRLHHIPVIVISADATPRQIDQLLAAGVRAYLTKPIDLKRFLSALDECLKEHIR
jgi:CheY-like chemotaxis protein